MVQPGDNVFDGVAVEGSVKVLRHIADVWCREHAVDFMSASSAAPTSPRDRRLRMRWMVRTSGCLKSSFFCTCAALAPVGIAAVVPTTC
jgi:hypothetical protein